MSTGADAGTAGARFRITAVADSDSYLKFACATLQGLGPEWERRVLLVRSPLQPTHEQLAAATAGTFQDGRAVPVVPAGTLRSVLAGSDVVLAAATGPVAEEVFGHAARLTPRPALVSALPGVAIPATGKALAFRALGDAFITHSYAECRAFSDLAEALQQEPEQRILVSRLPFLKSNPRPEPVQAPLKTVVFAPQAKVPVEREDRVAILQALAALARRSGLTVRVKLRAWAGEPQTHREQYPFDTLWNQLVEARAAAGHELEFCTGSMADQLAPGTAMVTVSSTAALEAVDAGLPVLILSDFGVSEEMLNKVFTGSGLLGTLDDLKAGRFFHPEPGWLRDNYFHQQDTPLGDLLALYARRARAGKLVLSDERLAANRRRRLRLRLRTLLPAPALKLVLALRR
ncbi:hypothetical protein LVY72_17485 [Arthrobacter sp. I2-34]|uniref:Uncharacterized protein n=1 Tax=Arthrobacter hankyongi TaxID=2904801 RepID=A0ABS9LAH4_9MICC|nr:DUF6716 putative glycosyltransferase [Arthrobacter hankyongi]MCG2623689.1 hypothetical protein [Arthrobacter hankyongi]